MRLPKLTAAVRADKLMYERQREWSGVLLGFDRLRLRDLIAEEIRAHAEQAERERDEAREAIREAERVIPLIGWSAVTSEVYELLDKLRAARGGEIDG